MHGFGIESEEMLEISLIIGLQVRATARDSDVRITKMNIQSRNLVIRLRAYLHSD